MLTLMSVSVSAVVKVLMQVHILSTYNSRLLKLITLIQVDKSTSPVQDPGARIQLYTFVYILLNTSSSCHNILSHYKGNQSKFTIAIGLYTTVHATGPRKNYGPFLLSYFGHKFYVQALIFTTTDRR